MGKKVVFISAFLIFMKVLALGVSGSQDGGDLPEIRIIEEQIKAGGVDAIGESISRYADESSMQLFPDFDPESILRDISTGQFNFSVKGFLEAVLQYVFHEMYLNINLLLRLVILAVLCAVLNNLQTSFLSESVGELAFYTCYIVMASIMILSFNSVITMAVTIIDNMVSFMQSTVPVLLTLLVAGGNITSAAIFKPVLISVAGIGATLLKVFFIPLIFLSTVLSIVDNISDRVQISRLSALLKQAGAWALGILMTVFIAVVSVEGTLGAVVDGVTSKTAKFAIGTFIPVAGKYLSDAADTVVGCTLLIKNAAGVVAMAGVIIICLAPILKIFALIAVYKLACVFVEPISRQRVTKCINDMAGSLTFIVGIIASLAVMFLISLAVIVCAGNISAMVR